MSKGNMLAKSSFELSSFFQNIGDWLLQGKTSSVIRNDHKVREDDELIGLNMELECIYNNYSLNVE